MKILRGHAGQQGFSLIEMLVALSILTIGLLAVASMQTVAVSNTSISHRMMSATELANEAMEDILAWDPANANLNASVTDAVYASSVVVAGGGRFDISYTTTINTPSIGTTRVDVRVTDVTGSKPISAVVITGFRKVV